MKGSKKNYVAALYMRLSKDDAGIKESSSISTQRKMLRSYAEEHGFEIYSEYIDDGWSGTNFIRPAWRQMIDDIENKKINLVLTKDLSRLGRDYITAGQYTEIYFPSKGIRYIAVNDGYDSETSCTDIAPFKNVINEMYARDISKKIRSAFHTKMEEGAFIGNFAPYGYQKDPVDKNHLIIDDNTAPIVQEMFQMASQGISPSKIAASFNERGILTPGDYRKYKIPYIISKDMDFYKKWSSSTVCKMLSNMVYLGHIVQGKTTKISFKSPVTIQNPKDQWIMAQHMHEPLITSDTFQLVRRRCISRQKNMQSDFSNLFSGIAKCADCGRNMSTGKSRRKDGGHHLVCGAYKLYGSCKCSNHFIDYQVLYEVVLKELQSLLSLSPEAEKVFLNLPVTTEDREEKTGRKRQIAALKQREQQLDRIIAHLYEDNENGSLEQARFYRLLSSYENEQKNISSCLEAITHNRQNFHLLKMNPLDKQTATDQSIYVATGSKLKITTLTPELLRLAIDKIEISQGYFEGEKREGHKMQAIKIHYKFNLSDS